MNRKIRVFDFGLIILCLILVSLGIAIIYSLVFSSDDSILVTKQIMSAILGIGAMIVFSLIDYRNFKGLWWIFYSLSILLLLFVDFFGSVSGGAMRWINIGFYQIQPSELAKIGIIVVMASYFSNRIGKLTSKDYFVSIIVLLVPFILILKEPDLGTALVVVFIYIMMLLASKPSKKQIFVIFSVMIIFFSVFFLSILNVSPFGSFIKDYQRDRVLTFIDPSRDPYGQGYNVKQAQIAIGAGGLWGKGLGFGSQSQLEFLPKPYTDFIFSGAAESLGFFGAGVILALFFLLIYKTLNIASIARDNFGMLICYGVAAMFLFQSCVNIGMNLGLAPVTGIPLPFLSYGGTSLLISFLSVGFVQSVYTHHRKIVF